MIMHLSAAIPGGDPEDIRGHDVGFCQLFDSQLDNFKPGMGELGCFRTFVAGDQGKIRGI